MLVFFTNTRLHTAFRLAPKSVTLNHVERRNDSRRAISLQYLCSSRASCSLLTVTVNLTVKLSQTKGWLLEQHLELN